MKFNVSNTNRGPKYFAAIGQDDFSKWNFQLLLFYDCNKVIFGKY